MQITILEYSQEKKESKMRDEDFGLIAQLIDSMALASRELEKALEKSNVDKINKLKNEILKFQRNINEVLD